MFPPEPLSKMSTIGLPKYQTPQPIVSFIFYNCLLILTCVCVTHCFEPMCSSVISIVEVLHTIVDVIARNIDCIWWNLYMCSSYAIHCFTHMSTFLQAYDDIVVA